MKATNKGATREKQKQNYKGRYPKSPEGVDVSQFSYIGNKYYNFIQWLNRDNNYYISWLRRWYIIS